MLRRLLIVAAALAAFGGAAEATPLAAIAPAVATAGATANCSLSATGFGTNTPSTDAAAQMTMSNCTDTKAVKWSQVSSLQSDGCYGSAFDCTYGHFEELISGGTSNCHLTGYASRQDWTCGNATGTIASASLYQYVYRPDIGWGGTCTWLAVIVGYQLQSYSTNSWSNLFYIAFPYTYVCHP